jgi:hypothetical protein
LNRRAKPLTLGVSPAALLKCWLRQDVRNAQTFGEKDEAAAMKQNGHVDTAERRSSKAKARRSNAAGFFCYVRSVTAFDAKGFAFQMPECLGIER